MLNYNAGLWVLRLFAVIPAMIEIAIFAGVFLPI